MYFLSDFKGYAYRLGFKTAEQAEKDYLQELLLRAIFSKIPERRLVFRGGTALSKVYSTGRASDDLDFVYDYEDKDRLKRQVEEAVNSLADLYPVKTTEEKPYRDMLGYKVKINGPLYTERNDSSSQAVSIDINTYEKVVLKPASIIRIPIYTDIPPYTITIKQLEELFVDKLFALVERKRLSARDLYDIWIILRKGYAMDEKKLKEIYGYYADKKTVSYDGLLQKIDKIGDIWDDEINMLTNANAGFKVVKEDVVKRLKPLLPG